MDAGGRSSSKAAGSQKKLGEIWERFKGEC
jgi:hypothetical protein